MAPPKPTAHVINPNIQAATTNTIFLHSLGNIWRWRSASICHSVVIQSKKLSKIVQIPPQTHCHRASHTAELPWWHSQHLQIQTREKGWSGKGKGKGKMEGVTKLRKGWGWARGRRRGKGWVRGIRRGKGKGKGHAITEKEGKGWGLKCDVT